MTADPFIVFTALLLKHRNLRCPLVTGDARRHSRSTNRRAPDLSLAVASQHEHIQLDRLADFLVDRRHADGCAVLNPELLAAGFYDCIRHMALPPWTGLTVMEKSFIIGVDHAPVNAPAAVVCD